MKLEVVKHVRDGVREYRNGSVREITIRTWDVVDVERCCLVSEHETKRAALAAKAAEEARSRNHEGGGVSR